MMDFAEINKLRKAQRQAEERDVKYALDRMRELIGRVPVQYQKWNYQRVVEYKKLVGEVNVMLKPGGKLPTLTTATIKLRELEAFGK